MSQKASTKRLSNVALIVRRHWVAGILTAEGKILMCHRTATRAAYPSVWDLPGGHVEPGEGPPDAIRRELREELGVVVCPAPRPVVSITGVDWTLDCWSFQTWDGEVGNAAPDEHDVIKWCDRDQIAGLLLADERLRDLLMQLLAPSDPASMSHQRPPSRQQDMNDNTSTNHDEANVHGGRLSRVAANELCPLPRVDYGDVFTLASPHADRWSAEAWGRAVFGNSPDLMERFIWQGLLQLRLRRRASSDTVAGWPIIERTDTFLRLETRSWFLTGNLIVSTEADSVTLGTFVRYDRRAAAGVWLPLSAIHRRLMPGLLRDAKNTLSGGSGH